MQPQTDEHGPKYSHLNTHKATSEKKGGGQNARATGGPGMLPETGMGYGRA